MVYSCGCVLTAKDYFIMADEKDLETIVEDQEVSTEEAVAEAQEAEAVEQITEEVMADATEAEVVEAEEQVGVVEESASTSTSHEIPDFRAGDVLRLGVRIQEGEKIRTQFFEGIVLSRKGAGVNQTFTIRKIGAGGIAVERIFPLYSPSLVSFEVRRRGIVRRAKVYFLRDIVGSTANVIKERKVVRDRTEAKAAKAEKKAARVARKNEVAPKASKAKKTTRSAKRSAQKSDK
jgi:large subunit ribosomal protein L19